MRYSLLLCLLALVNVAFGQKTGTSSPAQYKTGTCHSTFPKVKLDGRISIDAVQNLLNNNSDGLKDKRADLKLNYKTESLGGTHYSFTQLFNGVPVYQSEIKVNIDKNGVVRSIFDNSYNTTNWTVSTAKADENSVIAINSKTNMPVLAHRTVMSHQYETLTAYDGTIIFQTDLNCYYQGTDSTVRGLVFNPDPLTTSQHSCGISLNTNAATEGTEQYDTTSNYWSKGPFDGPWIDEAWLDSQQQSHTFKANFGNGVFSLQSPFVMLTNYDTFPPDVAPVTSTTGVFNYSRSQSGFQDVNAFYHISTYHDYVHSLGFNCADSFVYVDTHSMYDDNSYFTWDYTPCRIYYGVGGVPDAEDADVVVHEYCHFLSFTAAPQSNQGYERRSLDEGFCDYNAASYSKNLNPFGDWMVYNWDGHNQFWPGRVVNSTSIYPAGLDGNIYDNGQMWSAALFELNSDIGRGVTDSLIIQAHYSYAMNIAMSDAAQLLIDADSVLYGGEHFCDIFNRLLQHGFVSASEKGNCTLISTTAVGDVVAPELNIGFLQHGNWFTVTADNGTERVNIQLYAMTGQEIAPAIVTYSPVYNFQDSDIPRGVYLVSVTTGNTHHTFKWVNTGY